MKWEKFKQDVKRTGVAAWAKRRGLSTPEALRDHLRDFHIEAPISELRAILGIKSESTRKAKVEKAEEKVKEEKKAPTPRRRKRATRKDTPSASTKVESPQDEPATNLAPLFAEDDDLGLADSD